jgi:hypothetical protein
LETFENVLLTRNNFISDKILGLVSGKSANSFELKSIDIGELEGLYKAFEMKRFADRESSEIFSVELYPFMKNLLGKLHGGAIAVACEEALYQSSTSQGNRYHPGRFHASS